MNVKEKRRRAIIYGGIIVLIFLAVIFVVLSIFNKNNSKLPSNISSLENERLEGTVAGEKASNEYNQMIKKHDDSKANEALQGGQSYFSIPINQKDEKQEENIKQPLVLDPKPEQSLLKKNELPKKEEKLAVNFTQDEFKRMMEAIDLLDENLNTQIGLGEIVFTAIPEPEKQEENLSEQNRLIENQKKFSSGSMLYAIVDTAINSDVSSPIMATVVSGEFRKTKFIGTFARFDKRLVIKFDRAVLPDGTEISMEAYAIDPKTTEASVASKVNTHFFSRWGGLIAASFLEGFGEATQYSGAESVDNVYGESTGNMIFGNYSVAEQAIIAAGKVGERASEIFAQKFNRPPTVYLNMGSAIGILILNSDS